MNHLRERREARAWSQAALADEVGLTRQSVNAIETGRSVPSVDVALRLGRALECTVEDLFGEPARETLEAKPGLPGVSSRVALARVRGCWRSYPLGGWAHRSADGIASSSRSEASSIELLRAESACRETVVVMGCALALGLLCDRLNAERGGGRFSWFSTSSGEALRALAEGRSHLAGVHLIDERSGEANVPDVRRQTRGQSVVLVTLGNWEAGLVVARGNPHGIRSGEQLGRRGLRLVVREPGSGARRRLDLELGRASGARNPEGKLPSHTLSASSHLEVAHAVALGAADVGLATRDAALAFGLDFVPLAEERYDLALPREALSDARVARLFDALTSTAFRHELAALGYDTRTAGTRVAEVRA